MRSMERRETARYIELRNHTPPVSKVNEERVVGRNSKCDTKRSGTVAVGRIVDGERGEIASQRRGTYARANTSQKVIPKTLATQYSPSLSHPAPASPTYQRAQSRVSLSSDRRVSQGAGLIRGSRRLHGS